MPNCCVVLSVTVVYVQLVIDCVVLATAEEAIEVVVAVSECVDCKYPDCKYPDCKYPV